jgi:hypothetical protein
MNHAYLATFHNNKERLGQKQYLAPSLRDALERAKMDGLAIKAVLASQGRKVDMQYSVETLDDQLRLV